MDPYGQRLHSYGRSPSLIDQQQMHKWAMFNSCYCRFIYRESTKQFVGICFTNDMRDDEKWLCQKLWYHQRAVIGFFSAPDSQTNLWADGGRCRSTPREKVTLELSDFEVQPN